MNKVKNECELLLSSGMDAVKSMFIEQDGFHPIGKLLTPSKEVESVLVDLGEDYPEGAILVDAITDFLKERAEKGEILASAIFFDARVGAERKDAVVASLEHSNDYSVMVVHPYTLDLNQNPVWEEPIAWEGQRNVFT